MTARDPHRRNRDPDDNHVYLWLVVPEGRYAGRYECAVNTGSEQTGAVTQFLVTEEEVAPGEFPTPGFWPAELSYAGLGLRRTDFEDVTDRRLRQSLLGWWEECTLVAAYGITYSGGDGLHDVHMHSGERPGSAHRNLENQDGALALYYEDPHGAFYRRWVFLKFSTQRLPE